MKALPKRAVKLIISWNGVETPFSFIEFDEAPLFDFVLFNYSGNGATPLNDFRFKFDELIHCKTEFKGSIIKAMYHHFKNNTAIDYVGFMDDDIEMKVSSINQLIESGYANELDAFQAAVHPLSYHSFEYNVLKPELAIEWVPWVEIMMPFYRKTLFDSAHEFYETNISSYGIDNFAIPFYQQIMGLTKTAVIHSVSMKHLKPVTDGSKVFSNGLTARQEGELVRKRIIQMIKNNRSLPVSPDFLKNVLALNRPRWQVWKNLLKDSIRRWF